MHRSTTTAPATPPSCLSLIETHVSPPRQRPTVHRLCCTVTHTPRIRDTAARIHKEQNRAVLRRALGTLRLSCSRIRRARATSPPRGRAAREWGRAEDPRRATRKLRVRRERAVCGGRADAPLVRMIRACASAWRHQLARFRAAGNFRSFAPRFFATFQPRGPRLCSNFANVRRPIRTRFTTYLTIERSNAYRIIIDIRLSGTNKIYLKMQKFIFFSSYLYR